MISNRSVTQQFKDVRHFDQNGSKDTHSNKNFFHTSTTQRIFGINFLGKTQHSNTVVNSPNFLWIQARSLSIASFRKASVSIFGLINYLNKTFLWSKSLKSIHKRRHSLNPMVLIRPANLLAVAFPENDPKSGIFDMEELFFRKLPKKSYLGTFRFFF